MKPSHLIKSTALAAHYRPMRSHFERVFTDPHSPTPERFCWDPWFVPNQYSLLRTPAMRFFPKRLMDAFLRDLAAFGQKHLGCIGLTPPWLSLYLDGHEQRLHADLPHGPWAYVYSLTPASPEYRGGSTLLLRDRHAGVQGGAVEAAELFEEVPSLSGRLVVFDPKIPHGVSRVEGTSDPRQGRLVIHGWFTDPAPFVLGPLSPEETLRGLITKASGLLEQSKKPKEKPTRLGLIVFEISVLSSGEVKSVKLKQNTLTPRPSADLLKTLTLLIQKTRFERKSRPSRITLPLWLH